MSGLKDFHKNYKGCSFKHKIHRLFWEIRYAWQRAWRGYDCVDVFNIDTQFRERYLKILQEYNDTRHCLFNKDDGSSFSDEETKEIIDTMINYLKMIDEDYVEKKLFGTNIYDDGYKVGDRTREDRKVIMNVMMDNKNKFFEMFSEYYYQLWD